MQREFVVRNPALSKDLIEQIVSELRQVRSDKEHFLHDAFWNRGHLRHREAVEYVYKLESALDPSPRERTGRDDWDPPLPAKSTTNGDEGEES